MPILGGFPAWETQHGSSGEGRAEDCLGVGYRVSPLVGSSSPCSFAELFRARPGGYTPAKPHEMVRKKRLSEELAMDINLRRQKMYYR